MQRRTFLKSAAVTAAAAPFLGAENYSKSALSQIKHVVVVMMENRSFDHMLGWLPNADGKQAGLSYIDKGGVSHTTYPLAPDWTGCGFEDPSHSYDGGRVHYNNGAMDGFLQTADDTYPIGYYVEKDLPFMAAFARTFTSCDRYFCSILSSTFPNRIFQHAGQTDRLDNSFFFSQLPTIWDRLIEKNISCKYYYGNLPFLALFGLKFLSISGSYNDFLTDCQNGTLPAVSFVDPKLTLLLNFANDDHPHSDMRNGDAFLAETYQALASSPAWDSTVLIVNRDEWGGFFDHVPLPRVIAPNNVDPDLVDGKALLGVRVPAVVASPWNVGNPQDPTVSSVLFDHTSALRLIEKVWDLEPLGARDASNEVGSFLNLLNLGSAPVPWPTLPMPRSHAIPDKICFSSIDPNIIAAHTPAQARTIATFQDFLESGVCDGWPIYE